MENKTILGILAIVLGFIVISFPFISAEFITINAGLAVALLGIYWIAHGFQFWDKNKAQTVLYALVGIFTVLLGVALTGNLPFLIIASSFLLYIAGFLMIMWGVAGIIILNSKLSKGSAVLFVFFGIILLLFANLIFINPLYLAFIIGIGLIAEGITLAMDSGKKEVIESKEN